MVQLAGKLPLQRWRVQGHDTKPLEGLMLAKGTTSRVCRQCAVTFVARIAEVSRGGALFCSRECVAASHRTRVLVECHHCGKQFTTKPSKLNIGWGKYCSLHCRAANLKSDPVARFWSKVNKTDTCWLWTGHAQRYGVFALTPRLSVRAHRYSYELVNGPVPAGLFVLHSCPGGDNPLCVNPAHLRAGTALENSQDARERGQIPTGDRSGMRKHPERVVRGERHVHSKLTTARVMEMRSLYQMGGWTLAALARRFGVTYQTVGSIVRRETWKHV